MSVIKRSVLVACAVLLTTKGASAAPLQYQLKPEQIAPDTYLLQGKMQDFSRKNGGNIVNTGFVVTDAGVLVFDTGPSRRYGEAMRQAISEITDQPVVHVFNSHHHPDHFLGNQAFADSTIWALPGTGQKMAQQGGAFTENMYRLVGDWMRDTEMLLPHKPLEMEQLELGKHRFRFYAMKGHTGADLMMLDETTGVLFASDMVFYQRALTTPHTPGLPVWLAEMEQIADIPYKLLVPGHGPTVQDRAATDQMQDYLRWLDQTLTKAAEQGKSMTEVMRTPLKPGFEKINLSREEFARTVVHLYPRYEDAAF